MRSLAILVLLITIFPVYPQQVTLRDTTNQYDYIIITTPDFVTTCQPFKNHKETDMNLKTLIVDTTAIYQEFDSSATNEDNLRDFISYAGTFWKEPQPKYFLLVGNRSGIPNFTISDTVAHLDIVGTDFPYSQSKYDDDSLSVEFYIGRVPASNTQEAENYFSKVINYEEDQTIHSWNNKALFLGQTDSIYNFDKLADSVSTMLPSYMNTRLFTSDPNSIHYGNKDSIINYINNGASSVWFYGSPADSFYVSFDYFNMSDIDLIQNQDKYFVSVFYDWQRFAITSINCLSDKMLLSQYGSLAGIATVDIGYYYAMAFYFEKLAENFYSTHNLSLGEIMNVELPATAIYYHTKSQVNLWGDPSIRLKYDVITNVKNSSAPVPVKFSLAQNYPNPFNPSTVISYQLSANSFVTLKIYDLLGNEIKTLVNEAKEPGVYEVEFDASKLSSGVYFYQLKANNLIQTKKMILLR